MEIKNKVVIITGAARVGSEVARLLAKRGASIALTYFKLVSEVEKAASFCRNEGARTEIYQVDLSKKGDVVALIERVKRDFGRIDALVHMAAIYQKAPWAGLSEEDWDESQNAIAKSAFLLGKLVGDELLNNAGSEVVIEGKSAGNVKGKIITISDWSVLARPYKDYLPYNSAKGAVIALTKSLAKELAPFVLVNSVAPGPILAPSDLTEEENKEVINATPLARWGGAEEIAKAVLYLLEADFVTGQVLVVDGGRTIG